MVEHVGWLIRCVNERLPEHDDVTIPGTALSPAGLLTVPGSSPSGRARAARLLAGELLTRVDDGW